MQNQYCNSETGLHYNFFRYYEPNIGRFTQLDPIGLAGGETPYGYVHNPMGWVDLFGLAKCPSVMRRKNGEIISAKVAVKPSDIRTGTPVSNVARKGTDRLKGDDTGHLLAKVLGGSGKDLDNLFGQLRKVNRGDYRQFEKAIRERIETTGKSVNLEWGFQTFSGSGKRPDRILFKVFQDGKLVDRQLFNNF